LFGSDNPNAPLYVVMAGGGFLLIAAVCVTFVRDVAEPIPEKMLVPSLERVS
jgi:hypothetical protein